MKVNKHLLLLLITIIITSCEDNLTDKYSINSYPVSVGSTWTYERVLTNSYYRSLTSDSIVSSDSMVIEGTTKIEKDTTINKSKVLVFNTKENYHGNITTTINYYSMDKEGLKLIAYSYSGFMLYNFFEDTLHKPTLKVVNNGKVNSKLQSKTDIYIYSEPVLDIRYPLTESSEWTSTYPLKIEKKVIGTDILHLNGNEYVCLKVLWKYPDGYSIKITEWIAKEGVLKRVTNFGTMYLQDQNGNFINKFKSVDCVTIKSVSIKK